MTAAYFDSSAIVKLYANELHHEAVRGLVEVPICTSLARVEVIAAFFGKARSGEITVDVAEVLRDVFLADWGEGRFLRIAHNDLIETEAAHLASAFRRFGYHRGDLPHTEHIADTTVTLPLFPTMTDADVDRVCAACADVLVTHRRQPRQ